MWKRRLLFSLIFFIGTLLAAFGWTAEFRHWAVETKWIVLIGHALQVIGVFGHLITPDGSSDEDYDPFSLDEEMLDDREQQ